MAADAAVAHVLRSRRGRRGGTFVVPEPPLDGGSAPSDGEAYGLEGRARRIRETSGADVGLAVRARPRGSELAVSIAIASPVGDRRQTRTTYTAGLMGRSQAALLAAATLMETLRDQGRGDR